MMILCKTINTFLGFPDRAIPRRCRHVPPPENGGLRYVIDDPPPPEPPESPDRGDPGGWGLHEAAASAGGIGLCTEGLGSESCDVGDLEIAARSPGRRSRLKTERAARRKFPPPLPWLAETSGRRSCFMKGERRDGRFLLTEVTIERPEVLRASRHNGRLRLHLVDRGSGGDEDDDEYEEEKIEEEEEERLVVSPVAPTMLRCQDAVSGNRNMPMWWSQSYVTTV